MAKEDIYTQLWLTLTAHEIHHSGAAHRGDNSGFGDGPAPEGRIPNRSSAANSDMATRHRRCKGRRDCDCGGQGTGQRHEKGPGAQRTLTEPYEIRPTGRVSERDASC